jgi:hypothetical protein
MKSLALRVDYFRKLKSAAHKDENRPVHPIKNWRGNRSPMYLKIVEVDSDYLMFRLENSRTEIQQLKYLREHPSLPRALFNNPESNQAQIAQEEILNQLNKSAGKEFSDDLKTRGQDEPAIITNDGYLINGNRRTAALKALEVRYVNCVILPDDTTPKDIYELEQELQISEDFREPYHWINELRNIKKGLEDQRLNYTEKEIASRLRIKEKELQAMRTMLDLLDAFLFWKAIPGQYDYPKLDDAEQIFIQLEKAKKKFNRAPEKFAELKNGVFVLIEEKPSKGRLYGYVTEFIKNFEKIYAKFQADRKHTKKAEKGKASKGKQSILDKLVEGASEEPRGIFSDSKNAATLADEILEKMADVKAENKEQTDSEAVYEAVSSSLRELQGLVIDNDTAKLVEIRSKLEQIISSANSLIKQVKDFEDRP